MIALGILLILYAASSAVWPLFGKQLLLMTWLRFLPVAAQWGVRAALAAAGVALVVVAIRRRRGAG